MVAYSPRVNHQSCPIVSGVTSTHQESSYLTQNFNNKVQVYPLTQELCFQRTTFVARESTIHIFQVPFLKSVSKDQWIDRKLHKWKATKLKKKHQLHHLYKSLVSRKVLLGAQINQSSSLENINNMKDSVCARHSQLFKITAQ